MSKDSLDDIAAEIELSIHKAVAVIITGQPPEIYRGDIKTAIRTLAKEVKRSAIEP